MAPIKENVASFLYKIGVSANFLTVLGLFFAALTGFFIVQGLMFSAGLALLFCGTLDLLDGAVARVSGKAEVFGGILDSSLDRYGDGFVFGGILFFCMGTGRRTYAVLAFSALLGSFLTSYVRARAECEIEDCRVGFWERGERIVVLIVGLFLNNLAAALWVLGTATHVTALQRLAHSRTRSRQPSHISPNLGAGKGRISSRRSPAYLFKIAVLTAILLFWRPLF